MQALNLGHILRSARHGLHLLTQVGQWRLGAEFGLASGQTMGTQESFIGGND